MVPEDGLPMAGWRQKVGTESGVWSWAEGLPLGMKEIHPILTKDGRSCAKDAFYNQTQLRFVACGQRNSAILVVSQYI